MMLGHVCGDCGHAWLRKRRIERGEEVVKPIDCPRCGGQGRLTDLAARINELQAWLDHGTEADGEGDMGGDDPALAGAAEEEGDG